MNVVFFYIMIADKFFTRSLLSFTMFLSLLFLIFTMLRLACTALLWLSLQDSSFMTSFFLVYLTGFFFDAADGPSGLLLPEAFEAHPVALKLYNFTEQCFVTSFFFLMACQNSTVELWVAVFLLGFYYIIGVLTYMIGFNVFHTMCLSSDCLYQHLGKKALRLAIKMSSIFLMLEYLKPAVVDSFSATYLQWVQLFGSFYMQSIWLLGATLFFCYILLLISLLPSSLSTFNNDTRV